MSTIKRVSLSEQVFNSIIAYTQDHRMQVGDKLPTEGEFAVLFNVSRTSVREATKALGMNGAVQSIPGKGTYICQPMLNYILNDGDNLVFEADVSIAQMMEVRIAVELLAGELAIERATGEDIDRLVETLDDLRAAIRNGERWSPQDAAFHVCLAECSKNPLVDKMVAAYSDTMRKYLDAMVESNTMRDMEQHIQEHDRILSALRARDKAVMRASVRNHLESTKAHLLRLVDENTAIQFINR